MAPLKFSPHDVAEHVAVGIEIPGLISFTEPSERFTDALLVLRQIEMVVERRVGAVVLPDNYLQREKYKRKLVILYNNIINSV